MPLYEYQCDACGKRFEVIHQKFSDAAVDECRHCGKGPVHRLLSSPAIQFKGSGWYITDYAQKGKPDGQKPGDAPAGEADKADTGKSDAAKSDGAPTSTAAKTETKTASAPAASTAAKTAD